MEMGVGWGGELQADKGEADARKVHIPEVMALLRPGPVPGIMCSSFKVRKMQIRKCALRTSD